MLKSCHKHYFKTYNLCLHKNESYPFLHLQLRNFPQKQGWSIPEERNLSMELTSKSKPKITAKI